MTCAIRPRLGGATCGGWSQVTCEPESHRSAGRVVHRKSGPITKESFAVTLYDPDAPTGSGWWHWVVYNIPGSTTSLPAGAGDPSSGLLPAGAAQGNTDFGTPGYGGPCPPQGDKPHRYIVTVFALDTDKLDL